MTTARNSKGQFTSRRETDVIYVETAVTSPVQAAFDKLQEAAQDRITARETAEAARTTWIETEIVERSTYWAYDSALDDLGDLMNGVYNTDLDETFNVLRLAVEDRAAAKQATRDAEQAHLVADSTRWAAHETYTDALDTLDNLLLYPQDSVLEDAKYCKSYRDEQGW